METQATVVSFDWSAELATTLLLCADLPSDPVAPAGLYETFNRSFCVIELHQMVEREATILRFETYGGFAGEPLVGQAYILRSWWLPDARELVADTSRSWHRERYPVDSMDCVWCPLTWKWFGPNHGEPGELEGYRSGEVWITTAAYERYIRDDVLRLRRSLDHTDRWPRTRCKPVPLTA